MFLFALGLWLVGMILCLAGSTTVGLCLVIPSALILLVYCLLVVVGLVILASEHPEVRRRK